MIYTIPKGKHKSSYLLIPTLTEDLVFEAIFNETCIYNNIDPKNQFDINKLYGFSESWDLHKNSARFGWKWEKDKVAIFAYCYCNSKRFDKFICNISLNGTYVFRILIVDNQYHFSVLDKFKPYRTIDCIMDRGARGRTLKYKLWPYFGGDEVSDHDIDIQIRQLYRFCYG